jgi:hypothetical protein
LILKPTLQGQFSTDHILGAQVARANAVVIEEALTEKTRLERHGSIERARLDAEAERQQLSIHEEIETERAERTKNISMVRAAEESAARVAQEQRREEAERAKLLADRSLEEEQLENERLIVLLREQMQKAVELEKILREEALALAEQERQTHISEAEIIKYLSVNCHIHQNVSAGELNQSQPVVDFLAPASAQTAPLGKPTQSAFNHPAAGGKACFAGDGAFLDHRLTAFSFVFDMHNVASLLHKLMDVGKIITFIGTEMLFGLRAFDDNRDNEIIRRPLVVLIGSRQHHDQGSTALVHQDVDLAAPFAPIGWILPGLLTTQGGRTAFTVNRLPCPLDFPFLGVELDHDLHNLVEDTQLLPSLEAFMQRAAAHPKPVFVDRLPLASGPQHIPDPVQYGPVIRSGSSYFTFLGRLR